MTEVSVGLMLLVFAVGTYFSYRATGTGVEAAKEVGIRERALD